MNSEADTCRLYIEPKLHAAGWEDDAIREQVTISPGRIVPLGNQHTRQPGLRPDYVLYLRCYIPIAVLEAKAAYKLPGDGLQKATDYLKRTNRFDKTIVFCVDQ